MLLLWLLDSTWEGKILWISVWNPVWKSLSCSFLISCSHATIFFSSSFLFCSLTHCEKRDEKCLCLLTQHSVTVSMRAKSTARAGLDIVCTWHRGNASGERGKLQCLRHLILTNGAQYLWGMLWVRIRKKKILETNKTKMTKWKVWQKPIREERDRDSQLCGVLGDALGQRAQSTVTAAHHCVWACARVWTARDWWQTHIVLYTWRENQQKEWDRQTDAEILVLFTLDLCSEYISSCFSTGMLLVCVCRG